MGPGERADRIARGFTATSRPAARQLLAIAGAPGSGKSTVAADVVATLRRGGTRADLVPMDGFHLDNAVLAPRGLLPRKGAPETFDLAGFSTALARLAAGGEVILPSFDRSLDRAIAGAVAVEPGPSVVVVEGNYLLLDEPGWRDLARFWSYSVYLDVDDATLEARLIRRWKDHGLDPDAARARALSNDLPNACRIASGRLPADLVI